MSADLDREMEPEALAARGLKLVLENPLRDWARLAAFDPQAAAGGQQVRLDLQWRLGEDGVPILEGELAVGLSTQCQRCLEGLSLELSARPKLYFGRAEQMGADVAAAGFEACEPEPGVTLRQLLEDEILLSWPAFPAHGRSEECGPLAEVLARLEPADRGESTTSPFAVLAELKRG
jgi:uncharacterized protein